jgi:hypothetical protein
VRMRVFIWMSARTCMSVYICTMFLKTVESFQMKFGVCNVVPDDWW